MLRGQSIAGVGLALLLPLIVAACGRGGPAARDAPPPALATSTEAPRSAATTPTAGPPDAHVPSGLISQPRPLSELAPDAEEFLIGRQPQWSVAVILPERGLIYEDNGDELFALASVIKIAIMVTVMDQSMTQGRDLTPDEVDQLRAMITTSDNASASILWNELGGGARVREYLDSIGVRGIHPVTEGDNWGDSTGSAAGVAQLLAKLSTGQILDDARRRLALELLSDVVPDQRWGVSAAFRDDDAAIKDGWYESTTGWRVNSAGIDEAHEGSPSLVLAVMTRNQPSLETGVETIEGLALRIGAAVYGWQILSDAESPPDRATTAMPFAPLADGLSQTAGGCAAPSHIAGQPGAPRCDVTGEGFGDCGATSRARDAVACGTQPLPAALGVLVEPTEPLSALRAPDQPATPRLILLEDSSTCSRIVGPPSNDDGEPLTYTCSDGGVIVGGVQRGAVWSAFKLPPGLTAGVATPVVAAWY